MTTLRAQVGSTLLELLVVLVPIGLVAAGAMGFFSTHQRAHLQQDAAVAVEDNLRAAMEMVTDRLRTAGCGVPRSNLADWITWVPGFDNRPLIVSEGGGAPDQLSVAACAAQPLATITSRADPPSTTLTVASNFAGVSTADLFNTTDRSLILIGDTQHARVTLVSGNALHIDTDPTTAGDQGLTRTYLAGTPITRIDVVSFFIANDPLTETPSLRLDRHRGSIDSAAEGITDLQVTPVISGLQYQITLTARGKDPVSGADTARTLSADIGLRN